MPIYWFVVGQGKILLTMFSLGIAMGLLYDGVRILRRLFPVSKIIADVTDVLYWTFVTFWVWYVTNQVADGMVRFCQILAIAIGMLLYYSMMSPLVIWIVYTPLHFMGKHFMRLYRYIGKKVDSLWESVDNRIVKTCEGFEAKAHEKSEKYEKAAKKKEKKRSR